MDHQNRDDMKAWVEEQNYRMKQGHRTGKRIVCSYLILPPILAFYLCFGRDWKWYWSLLTTLAATLISIPIVFIVHAESD